MKVDYIAHFIYAQDMDEFCVFIAGEWLSLMKLTSSIDVTSKLAVDLSVTGVNKSIRFLPSGPEL